MRTFTCVDPNCRLVERFSTKTDAASILNLRHVDFWLLGRLGYCRSYLPSRQRTPAACHAQKSAQPARLCRRAEPGCRRSGPRGHAAGVAGRAHAARGNGRAGYGLWPPRGCHFRHINYAARLVGLGFTRGSAMGDAGAGLSAIVRPASKTRQSANASANASWRSPT